MPDQTDKIAELGSAEIQEKVLASAVAKLTIEYNSNHDRGILANLQAAGKALDDCRRGKLAALSGEKFPTQTAALEYLQRTWQIEKSKLSKDFTAGKVPRKEGMFTAKDLDFYAAGARLPLRTVAPQPDENIKNELEKETLRALRDKNDIRIGLYVLRAKYEQDLAMRAAYLKTDLSNYGPRIITLLMEKMSDLLQDSAVTLPDTINLQSFIPDLEQHYDEELDKYLHQYATRKSASVTTG